MKDKKVSFMTYDVESLFKSTPADSKYASEHIPFLICYNIIVYNKSNDDYEFI
jgi:hypothetical protein